MMHGKGLNLLVFVLVMGPLIWFSQRMHWGDTGTFVCVVLGIVFGFFILIGGKKVSRKVGRTFGGTREGAAADFLFGPADPGMRQMEMQQMHRQINDRVGNWNAPSLQRPGQPMMPNPYKRPGSAYDLDAPPQPLRTKIQMNLPETPAYALPAMATPMPQPDIPRRPQPQNNGPLLELGPGAQMYLTTSMTGMLIVDAQLRRLAAPVFLEEWIRLGLGLLVIDVYGQYTGYMAHMSPSFGFLAGSPNGQEHLTEVQISKYMPIASTQNAMHVGQNIRDEGLQVIFNFASYSSTTEAGTYLLALLSGIERKVREFATNKPCAIYITDVRPFAPADEADCGIENSGVAQHVYDQLMNMMEHAGQPGLKNLSVCLATPSVEGIEEETLTTSRLWIVNCVNEQELQRICRYLELTQAELDQLLDGDTMLFDTVSDGVANFVRFRRPGLLLGKPMTPGGEQDYKTSTLPDTHETIKLAGNETIILGGDQGLGTQDQK